MQRHSEQPVHQPSPLLPADRALRTRIVLWGLLLAGVGFAGLHTVMSYLDPLTALHTAAPQLAAEQHAHLLRVLGLSQIVLASITGGLLGRLFVRAWQNRQFPPPGVRFPWATRVWTGKEARRLATVGLVLPSTLLLGVLGMAVLMLRVASLVAPAPPRPLHEAASCSSPPCLDTAVVLLTRLVGR